METTGIKPTPRFHCGYYQITADKLLIFGGIGELKNDSVINLNDLWELDLENNVWKEIKCIGEIPSPRFGSSLFGQSNNNLFYCFGGLCDNNEYDNTIFKFEYIEENNQMNCIKCVNKSKIDLIESAWMCGVY